jgi:NAD(P)H dehydrogenase (quinone)
MSIVITGANGEFGRGVLDAVAAIAGAQHLVAAVRDPARAADLQERGIEVRPADFGDPAALPAAFRGASTVFVNATFFGAAPELRGQRVAAAIRSAADAGAARIVVTSWPDLDHAAMPSVRDFAQTERLVQAAGPAWTILRGGYGLADAVARDVVWARRGGELVAPAGAARVTPAALPDLVQAAAVTVTETGHENTRYELTGPRAVDWNDLAGLAAELEGRDIRYRPVDDDQYRGYLAGLKLPASAADSLLALYAEFRSGWNAVPAPDLAALLGRAPADTLDAVRARAARLAGLL